jgi:hypothetical protein
MTAADFNSLFGGQAQVSQHTIPPPNSRGGLTVAAPRQRSIHLKNPSWENLDLKGVATELYYEVVNDRLCIKFDAVSEDATTRRHIRDAVRRAAHAILDGKFKRIDAGHLSTYMTGCQVEHDFSLLTDMDTSVTVFAGVGRYLALIADRLRSAG